MYSVFSVRSLSDTIQHWFFWLALAILRHPHLCILEKGSLMLKLTFFSYIPTSQSLHIGHWVLSYIFTGFWFLSRCLNRLKEFIYWGMWIEKCTWGKVSILPPPSPNFTLWQAQNDVGCINLMSPKFQRPEQLPPFAWHYLSGGEEMRNLMLCYRKYIYPSCSFKSGKFTNIFSPTHR